MQKIENFLNKSSPLTFLWLIQKHAGEHLNVFVMLSNQGYGVFELRSKQFCQLDTFKMERWFPELHMKNRGKKVRPPIAMDIMFDKALGLRYTCTGDEDGTLSLSVVKVDSEGAETKEEHVRKFSAPIAQVTFVAPGHLLVAATWEGAVMYFDYDVHGLSKGIMVYDSMNHDVVTSICPIERLDGHGFCIGTFGKTLLTYKIEGHDCVKQWQRKFRTPVLQIRSFDLTGDGLQDIAVISAGGLHLLQLNDQLVTKHISQKIAPKKN